MMSFQCEYVRIFELISSVNVILLSPLSHKNTMAGFEGGGAMVTTSKYALYDLVTSCLWPPFRLRTVGLYLAICQLIGCAGDMPKDCTYQWQREIYL